MFLIFFFIANCRLLTSCRTVQASERASERTRETRESERERERARERERREREETDRESLMSISRHEY
jgi:hypothetical protein